MEERLFHVSPQTVGKYVMSPVHGFCHPKTSHSLPTQSVFVPAACCLACACPALCLNLRLGVASFLIPVPPRNIQLPFPEAVAVRVRPSALRQSVASVVSCFIST